MTTEFNPENDLSPDEYAVLKEWQKHGGKIKAYKAVMVSKDDDLQQVTVEKRANRFFKSKRLQAAMMATPGKFGEKARQDFEAARKRREKKAKEELAKEDVKRFIKEKTSEENVQRLRETFVEGIHSELSKADSKLAERATSSRQHYRDEMCIVDQPSAVAAIGSTMIAMSYAMECINERMEIWRNLSDEDKLMKSAILPSESNTLKWGTELIMASAPPLNASTRNEMSKAAKILRLSVEAIQERPEDYAASVGEVIDTVSERNDG